MLAEKALGLETREAVMNLKAYGIVQPSYYFKQALDAYQYKCSKAHHKYWDFWQKARKSELIYKCSELRATCAKLEIQPPKNPQGWLDGLGQLIGFATKEEAEDGIVMPKMYDDSEEIRKQTGPYRTFVGKHWKNVIVIPMFDMPGRIREFRFIGLNEGKLVQASKFLHHKHTHQKSPALAFFDQIIKYTTHSKVLVMDDLITALKLQARNIKDGKGILPIAAADSSQFDLLKSFPTINFTIFNPALNIEVFPKIKQSGSKVFIDSPGESSLGLINKLKTDKWLAHITENSKDWKTALEEWLPSVRQPQRAAAIGNLELSALEISELQRQNYPVINEELENIHKKIGTVVVALGKQFYERTDGWVALPDHEIISPATVRVEAIFRTNDGKERLAGYVSYGDVKYKFVKPINELKDKGCDFISSILKDAGVSVSGLDTRYDGYIYELALAFSKPRIVNLHDDFGWDEGSRSFRFKSFSISHDGEVAFNELSAISIDYSAGVAINPPIETDKLTLTDFLKLSRSNNVNESFWLLVAYTLRCIIGSAVGLKPFQCFYYSNAATNEVIHRLCEILGISDDGYRFDTPKKKWPAAMFQNTRRKLKKSFEVWLTMDEKPNCLIEVRPDELHSLRLIKNYPVFKLDGETENEETVVLYKRVLTQFMAWSLKTHGLNRLASSSDGDLIFGIIHSLKDWLIANGCSDTSVFNGAADRISLLDDDTRDTALECFAVICRNLYKNKIISAGKTFLDEVWVKENSVLVLKKKILKFYRELGFSLVGASILDDKLGGLCPGEACPEDRWALPKSWWEQDVLQYLQNIEDNKPIKRRKPKNA